MCKGAAAKSSTIHSVYNVLLVLANFEISKFWVNDRSFPLLEFCGNDRVCANVKYSAPVKSKKLKRGCFSLKKDGRRQVNMRLATRQVCCIANTTNRKNSRNTEHV